LRDPVFASFFFETFFLEAAFFFGMRSFSSWLQTQPAIIQIRSARGSLSRQGKLTGARGLQDGAACSATTVV
jgi:hypothetical protein